MKPNHRQIKKGAMSNGFTNLYGLESTFATTAKHFI